MEKFRYRCHHILYTPCFFNQMFVLLNKITHTKMKCVRVWDEDVSESNRCWKCKNCSKWLFRAYFGTYHENKSAPDIRNTVSVWTFHVSSIQNIHQYYSSHILKIEQGRNGGGGGGGGCVCGGGRGYILSVSIDCRMDHGFMKSILYVSCYVKGIFTVSPEPSLFVHMKYGSKRRVRQKI